MIYRFSQAWKRSLHFFFPHVSRAQHLTLARTRTQVVQLGAQCTDHWTTGQSRGIGVPAVHLTTHVKSSTLYGCTVIRLYGRTSKFFQPDGLLQFCIIMGLCKLHYNKCLFPFNWVAFSPLDSVHKKKYLDNRFSWIEDGLEHNFVKQQLTFALVALIFAKSSSF